MRLRPLATPLAAHILALIVFSVEAIALSWPLAASLDHAIAGASGDNLAFLWNAWWMRMALASPALDFFHTDYVFAPFGIDLTLHTHTALPAWISSTALGSLPVVTAQNVVILGSLALNGFAAYLLAWDRLRVWVAAIVAGTVFGSAAYVTTHLLGHYNLICAWGIPLFLLFLIRAVERSSRGAAIGAGLAMVATAYCDYYYVVYEVLLGLGLLLFSLNSAALFGERHFLVSITPVRVPAATKPLTVLLAIDLALVLLIVVSGGFTFTIAGIFVSATRPTNLLAIGWLLAFLLLLSRGRPALRLHLGNRSVLVERWRILWPGVATALIGLAPLLAGGWALWRRGDYKAPEFSWRGSPAGVDLATTLFGNPSNTWIGGWVRTLYEGLGIDRMESGAWLGVVPLVATIWALRQRWRTVPSDPFARETERWLVIGGVSFVWALGAWLRVGGFNAGLLLPQKLATLLPIVSNARIPGRAMVVVSLATAMIVASLLARARAGRRSWLAASCLIVVMLDSWSAPFPLTLIEIPALYEQLRDLPPGAVCELPTGIRDGFFKRGQLDERVMTYQMVHRHPLVGGFAARVPPSIAEAYARFPVLRSLMALSDGRDADPRDLTLTPDAAASALQQATVRYIVVDRATSSAPLVQFLERSIPLRLVGREGARELYVVKAAGES